MRASERFDDLADEYDRYRIGYAAEVYEALAERDVAPGARILDLACGTGLVAAELVARGYRVTGADVSEPMLRIARERAPGATFVTARAEALPFPTSSFDAATCAQAFHWFDEAAAIAELTRVVRPGGTIAIWSKALIRGDVVRLIRDEVIRELELPPLDDRSRSDFAAFDESTLVAKTLRVVPWIVSRSVDEVVGSERSRARVRSAYGDRTESYLTLLRERLAKLDGDLSLAYVQLVYFGRVPAPRL